MKNVIGKIAAFPQKEKFSYIGEISLILRSEVHKDYDLVYLDFFNSDKYIVGFLKDLKILN